MHHFQEPTLYIYQNERINQEGGNCGVYRTANTTLGRSKGNLQDCLCNRHKKVTSPDWSKLTQEADILRATFTMLSAISSFQPKKLLENILFQHKRINQEGGRHETQDIGNGSQEKCKVNSTAESKANPETQQTQSTSSEKAEVLSRESPKESNWNC